MRTAAQSSMERSLTVGILQQNNATGHPIIPFENPVEVIPGLLRQEGGTHSAKQRL
jgi:hypothetical protein